MLIHGGFWRAHRGLEMTTPAAAALAAGGWNVWNMEYRRACWWRDSVADCVDGFQHYDVIAAEFDLNCGTTLLVGHSAGGQLAGRVAGSHSGTPLLHGLVTLNAVVDLELAQQLSIGGSAVEEFLGPDATPADLRDADPAQHPPRVPTRCLHSHSDERVPHQISASYVTKACTAGGDIALVEVNGHHTAVIEPGSAAWTTVLDTVNAGWPNPHEPPKAPGK